MACISASERLDRTANMSVLMSGCNWSFLAEPWPGHPLWRARLKALMKLLVPWGAQAGTALLLCRYVKDGTLGGTGLGRTRRELCPKCPRCHPHPLP